MDRNMIENIIRIIDLCIISMIIISIAVGVYEYFSNDPILWFKTWGLDGKTLGMIDIFIGFLLIPYYYLLNNWLKQNFGDE